MHRLVDRGLIDYDEPVATYWPEFAAAGKERITVRQLLNHSAGLHHLRDVISDAYEMLDWDLVCTRLAAEAPRYTPGTRHGYHGITYGFLVGEVIRRVTGTTVHDAVDTEIVKPLDLDGMSIGAPPDQRGRVAELIVQLRRRGTQPNASRCARRALAWLRPAIDTFIVPGADRLFASTDVLDGRDPRGQRLLHRSVAGAHVRRARGRRRARRRALPLGGDAAARDRDPDDRRRHRRRASRCGGGSATTSPRRRAASSRTASGTSASADPARGPTPTTISPSAFVCNRVAGTPFGDTRFLRIGARARAAAATR